MTATWTGIKLLTAVLLQVSSFYLAAALYASMGFGAAGGIVMLAPVVLQVTGSRVYPIALGLCFTVEGLVSVVAGVVTGVCVCGWVGGWVRACVRACVCV